VLSLGPAECHASDILAEGDIGWAIEHGNVDDAERVIREIHATAEAQRMEMGRTARSLVDQQYSKQSLCGRFADVVEHGPQVDPSYHKTGENSAQSAQLSHQAG
jgi:glycosyltransferase involved in cell wall biosynthesis